MPVAKLAGTPGLFFFFFLLNLIGETRTMIVVPENKFIELGTHYNTKHF
jgi:hypothetical protein